MTDQPEPEQHDAPRLTTRQAAELLGVKPETVYAYVSRGQLSSVRAAGGRGSTIDLTTGKLLVQPLEESETWYSQKPGPQKKLGL
ncbi:helix-turn-helix domain-containing protein, partial [Streptomyces rubiginosohelvolus]|uniref:helix-turn-helix domain-containing protein n=1 Tax=Streptomyces rubiginosohelvolus TaxID=67362 RepID=UPI0033CB2266